MILSSLIPCYNPFAIRSAVHVHCNPTTELVHCSLLTFLKPIRDELDKLHPLFLPVVLFDSYTHQNFLLSHSLLRPFFIILQFSRTNAFMTHNSGFKSVLSLLCIVDLLNLFFSLSNRPHFLFSIFHTFFKVNSLRRSYTLSSLTPWIPPQFQQGG